MNMFNGELIEENGKQYRRSLAQPVDRFIIGVDLGQANDYTAVAVLQHSVRGLDKWTVREPKGRGYYGSLTQDVEKFFDLVALERIPLNTPYPVQALRIQEIMNHPSLRGAGTLVVDATGVGRPVVDTLAEAGLRPVRITLTGGNEAAWHDGERYSVPKVDIIGAAVARLHAGELKFAAGLALLEPLREELNNFQLLSRSATGHEQYGARIGKHDDLVIALGLAVFWATMDRELRRGGVSASHLRGLI